MAVARVRPAGPEDAAALARVQHVVWSSAYAGWLPAEVLAGFDVDAVGAGWAAAADAGGLRVAEEGTELVGFVAAGPAPERDLADATGDLPADAASVGAVAALLVAPRWGRRGHGGRLLVEAAAGLAAAGATRGIAWIPERDEASRRFYAHAGWEPDGLARTLDAGGRALREIRLAGPLDLRFAPEPTAADLGLPLL